MELAQGSFGLGDDRVVLLSLGQLDELAIVRELPFKIRENTQIFLHASPLAHDALRGFRIVPQVGIFGEAVQFFEARFRPLGVKDASLAVPTTA